jgi:hypothetical protein
MLISGASAWLEASVGIADIEKTSADAAKPFPIFLTKFLIIFSMYDFGFWIWTFGFGLLVFGFCKSLKPKTNPKSKI